jgi:Flp pilus assembly pilin Flp
MIGSLDATDERREAVAYMTDFLRDEQAQDIVEYTLLLAVIALAAGAAWVGIGTATSTIVSIRNNDLESAALIAH